MKTVQVLLSTYNGEKYLRDQIDSILRQKDVIVKIFVRDDGSTDSTISILEEYRCKGLLEYYQGENIGYKKSFLMLAKKCIGKADYYAFCDQDDFWLENKLIEAVKRLEKEDEDKYKLYFSNLIVTDERLNKIGYKDYSKLRINLGSAMCRFNISGCVMVFNDELLRLIIRDNILNNTIISHDSWIYKVCLSVGGKIVFDPNAYIYYRQHNNNVTGVRQGIKKRLYKEYKLFNIHYHSAKLIYDEYYSLITEENKKLLQDIINYKKNIFKTLKLIFNKELSFGVPIIDLVTKVKIVLKCL